MPESPVPSIPEDWLEAIARHIQVDAKSKDHATDEMLRVQNNKIQENAMLPLIHYLKTGDKQQQHDAAKALGYIARTGALTNKQRDEVKTYLLEIVKNATLSPGVAFAVLEALERVDPDAFLVIAHEVVRIIHSSKRQIQDRRTIAEPRRSCCKRAAARSRKNCCI